VSEHEKQNNSGNAELIIVGIEILRDIYAQLRKNEEVLRVTLAEQKAAIEAGLTTVNQGLTDLGTKVDNAVTVITTPGVDFTPEVAAIQSVATGLTDLATKLENAINPPPPPPAENPNP